jgi:putative FmdB family regulatory protein
MPIYDYGCSACGHVVEVIHGIHDAGPRFCPNCGREGTMKKAFATPAVHFKGSGWAKKDRSATSSPGKSRSSSSSESAATSTEGSRGDGSKAEAAPAKPAEKTAKAAEGD